MATTSSSTTTTKTTTKPKTKTSSTTATKMTKNRISPSKTKKQSTQQQHNDTSTTTEYTNNNTLSVAPVTPIYDIYDNPLHYSIPVPPYDPYLSPAAHHNHHFYSNQYPLTTSQPFPYWPSLSTSPSTSQSYPDYSVSSSTTTTTTTTTGGLQINAGKRQRRQAAASLVTGYFQRGGNNNVTMTNPNMMMGPGGAAAATATAAGMGPMGNGGNINTGTHDNNGIMKAPKKKVSTAQPRPHIAILPKGIGPIRDPNVNDVLAGRGGRINAHVGNVQFRDIVAQRKKDYLATSTKKLEKAHIAADIVYYIRRLDPPGRFLKEENDGAWWDIGDQKAIKKVGQALREDAIEVRDGDDIDEMNDETQEQQQPEITSSQSSSKMMDKPIACTGSTESTPTQTNRTIPINPTSPTLAVPIPAVTTSAGSNHMVPTTTTTSNKSATVVSGRGGKLNNNNNSGSFRSNLGRGGLHHHHQQQQQTQPTSVHIDIGSPDHYNHTTVPVQPPRHHHPSDTTSTTKTAALGTAAHTTTSTPFFPNPMLGFRNGITQRVAAVSGAAASAMKQQPRPVQEFDVPHYSIASDSQDEVFGRTFHHHGESSVLSGLSGGDKASIVSGMSGISALTDPMSSLSNSEGIYGQSRAVRQAQLDQFNQTWGSTPSGAVSNVHTSDNTPTLQLLTASNGIGSSLNNSTIMHLNAPTASTTTAAAMDHMDDGMSWAQHSLHGGGIGSIIEDVEPDQSILSVGNISGKYSFEGIPSSTSGNGTLMGTSSKHSKVSSSYRGMGQPKHGFLGTSPYYPGDASVAMSIASEGVNSIPSMSELSENLIALDLTNHTFEPRQQHEI